MSKTRVAPAAVAGVALVLLAVALRFWIPLLRPEPGQPGYEELWFLSWAGLRVAAWGALAGGAWLLVTAWTGRRARASGP
ncbi:hypothetical protein [Kineococcus xinjiangensis]|uniref:hypothetical protein n=1 Tax=Kineococcus xinjiangensis TaxID=512762 RepID=UPI0011B0D975|nr:hypothetical protein [Kineococcus xinjiangensis]